MSTKLIQTDLYLLLIDQAEIKEGDLKICLNDNYISKYLSKQNIESDTKCSDCKKIIAYYPLKEAKELDLPLLPNPFKEVDIEKLAEKSIGKMTSGSIVRNYELKGFIKGYKAAQQSDRQNIPKNFIPSIKFSTFEESIKNGIYEY